MKVLVVGGGGREHALVWKISQSPRVERIFCAPGNAGIAQHAACVGIKAEDVAGLLDFARREGIDLTVVGPEAPLSAGIVDAFEAAGLRIFGPRQAAARLEASKVFAKELMLKYGVPTAEAAIFDAPADAIRYVRARGGPCVVKAEGLAAGKGVVVADDPAAAEAAIRHIMEEKAFGAAGERVLVEERLAGEEASVLAFTDGETVLPLLPAQDHKPVFDGDKGPNTGGMGAYAPAPAVTPALLKQIETEILLPVVRGLRAEGIVYKGVLYAGLMLTTAGPRVLEFNVRFGDPEAQPLLYLLRSDLVAVMEAVLAGKLGEVKLDWHPGAAVCVVLAAAGYPGSYRKGDVIEGLEDVPPDAMVFHAGTAVVDGKLVTAGGRVLGVTARGPDVRAAIARAYAAVAKIKFAGMHYRRDIGQKALART
ncbi:phosphoribosylamine--glycine ligase [Thermodesulfitimonas autotrophica]|uniref:Phosphoribosylamine--glycine ligase n=1 Tax=Thermodesulfitimonas autotrophica TaxID=1894989 RepID=A0A3N5APP5_9THEO|nr:phosphoribosylamine--glycine ligase [Thermodesulfitimonas autotrophica]RPF47079.1 phosphoribosylamine--glycine ligase [Thermodesulfitimonas autotrophica]